MDVGRGPVGDGGDGRGLAAVEVDVVVPATADFLGFGVPVVNEGFELFVGEGVGVDACGVDVVLLCRGKVSLALKMIKKQKKSHERPLPCCRDGSGQDQDHLQNGSTAQANPSP